MLRIEGSSAAELRERQIVIYSYYNSRGSHRWVSPKATILPLIHPHHTQTPQSPRYILETHTDTLKSIC